MALTNLKRSGFVFITNDLILKKILNTKRSAAVFLMRVSLRKRLIVGLTKRFGYFGAPKCVAFLSTNKNNIICEKLPCPAA